MLFFALQQQQSLFVLCRFTCKKNKLIPGLIFADRESTAMHLEIANVSRAKWLGHKEKSKEKMGKK